MARVAVIGPGAIGSVVAAAVERLGRHDLTLCARRNPGSLQVLDERSDQKTTLACRVAQARRQRSDRPDGTDRVPNERLPARGHRRRGPRAGRRMLGGGPAEGAELPPETPDALVDHFRALPPDTGSSILLDRLAGRPLEWDALNGVVRRFGRRHGIPTPVSDVVAPLLAAISEGRGSFAAS